MAEHVLLPELQGLARQRYAVSAEEARWIDTWNQLLFLLGDEVALPGFPLWEPEWRVQRRSLGGLQAWEQQLVAKNHAFYLANRVVIDLWRRQNPQVANEFPASRRKLEWQAQDAPRDLWQLLLHLRPSGIRVKKATYVPALVAMNQTSIHGPSRRRLTPVETARLQGFDGRFSFGAQTDSLSYKQMGNAVNVGTAAYVVRRFVKEREALVRAAGPRGDQVADAVLAAAATWETTEQTA